MKSGFIAILGKPNAGKSSLMNALIGEKVSIVSPRAQTTRDKINGILTTDEYQMIFIDTPGIHKPESRLGEYMEKEARTADEGADAVVIVIDGDKRFDQGDIDFISRYLKKKISVYVVINKTDLAGFKKVYPILERLAPLTVSEEDRSAVKEIIPVSCKTKENVEKLKSFLVTELKDDVLYYPPDEITDKSERYMICEIVREKALLYLQDEIPHGVGVYLQSMTVEKNLAKIELDIICEKESHKPIIIGKDGDKLKVIAEKSRFAIEELLGIKAFLTFFVKVRENWRDKKTTMNDLGYSDKK